MASKPSIADAIYQGGASTVLGNNDPDKILMTFQGNHEGALLWGEKKHKDAYVQKYGYEKALGVIESAMKDNKDDPKAKEWYDDMEQYRADLLGKQGS